MKMKVFRLDRRGTTIVEVIVAFAVLMMLVSMVNGSLKMALDMTERSRRRREASGELLREYYLGEESGETGVKRQDSKAVLEFVQREGGDRFQMDVIVRQYSGESGTLYEVVSELPADAEERP